MKVLEGLINSRGYDNIFSGGGYILGSHRNRRDLEREFFDPVSIVDEYDTLYLEA